MGGRRIELISRSYSKGILLNLGPSVLVKARLNIDFVSWNCRQDTTRRSEFKDHTLMAFAAAYASDAAQYMDLGRLTGIGTLPEPSLAESTHRKQCK